MLIIRRYEELGKFANDWLNAHYHFSFSGYHDPRYMGLGPLRVINDDIVAPGGGFGMHPHRDMEIITYVRRGAIAHADHLGNEGKTKAGDVQVMSAGKGIVHSEHNDEQEPTSLYQIWIEPDRLGVPPRWEARAFPSGFAEDGLPLLVSGRPEDEARGALFIHRRDAMIHGGRLAAGKTLRHPLSGAGYLLVSEGEIAVGGQTLHKGDGAQVTGEKTLALEARATSEILVIAVPLPEASKPV